MSRIISETVKKAITEAAAKALASLGPEGINVVPVSMIKVNDSTIWLFDFFMQKTANNIKANPEVALTIWTGMTGLQIKGQAEYITNGGDFEEAVAFVASQNPSRVVQGLIVLTPSNIYDISPGGSFKLEELNLA